MTPEFNEAYRRGWNAFVTGKPFSDNWNPYVPRGPQRTQYLAWKQGWQESEMHWEDAQKRADAEPSE